MARVIGVVAPSLSDRREITRVGHDCSVPRKHTLAPSQWEPHVAEAIDAAWLVYQAVSPTRGASIHELVEELDPISLPTIRRAIAVLRRGRVLRFDRDSNRWRLHGLVRPVDVALVLAEACLPVGAARALRRGVS